LRLYSLFTVESKLVVTSSQYSASNTCISSMRLNSIYRRRETKVIFNNKKQLLCSNNLSLEMKKTLIKSCVWSVALYGSETWTLGKNEEGVINAFETWIWRRMLKIKWTDRITNDEVFQRVKE